MAYDTKTYLIQVGLGSLGFDFGPGAKYGAMDGDFGPKTQAAVAAFEASQRPPQPKPQTSFAVSLVAVAKRELAANIRETSKNQGPGIEKYWIATNYPDGYKNREPYCAAFICWLFSQVAGLNHDWSLPKSPVAYDFEKWASANAGKGVSVVSTPKAGDVFTLATASHVGLVVDVTGPMITTIEANTNASGSREGDGVYQRARVISSVRQFIRVA